MTRKSGWCIGPPGARIRHEFCRASGCSCECHNETKKESAD